MARTTARTGHTGTIRAVAALGVVAALLVAATACSGDAADDPHPDHRAFALHGRTLTVDSQDSALEMVPADVSQVKVTRWFRGNVLVGGNPRVTWAMKDDRLVLRVRCSGVVASCSAKHRIEVPRGVSVKVESSDGSVRAQGFKEPLDIRSRDGSVRVADSTGPLTLASTDGSIHASGVSARRVHATTRDGSVHLELGAVPDQVQANTVDGSVTITLPQASYRVSTQAQDGSVHVSVPRDPGSSHVVDAHTRDGSITIRTAG
ncbi:DUF4097 family beta strand repeat-containing protein [Streptomyces nodosus]|uniref:DUF4097 family beta strand repeat-containing protein n=1 Tax=Streptomyces nodosus TaxID=40318 RepID=UPI00380A2F29